MRRLDNWPVLMAEAISKAENTAHVWGENDCACFGASVAIAITGEDPMQEYRGKYTDEATAIIALKKNGHNTLYSALKAKFGPPVKWFEAQRGDWVLGRGKDGPAIGVVEGSECAFLGSLEIEGEEVSEGLVRLPSRSLKHFFKVGR